MRTWIHNHTLVVTLSLTALAFAAGAAFASYCLSSWLILPLI